MKLVLIFFLPLKHLVFYEYSGAERVWTRCLSLNFCLADALQDGHCQGANLSTISAASFVPRMICILSATHMDDFAPCACNGSLPWALLLRINTRYFHAEQSVCFAFRDGPRQ